MQFASLHMHMIHSNSAVDDHVDHRNLQAILDRRHTGRGHDRQLVLQILIINREIPLRENGPQFTDLSLRHSCMFLDLRLLHYYSYYYLYTAITTTSCGSGRGASACMLEYVVGWSWSSDRPAAELRWCSCCQFFDGTPPAPQLGET